jgi:hypothetical protein
MLKIRLPSGRWVSARAYLHGWKAVKNSDSSRLIAGWCWAPVPAGECLESLRRGVHDRINRHDRTRPASWRHLDSIWQTETARAALALNQSRVVIRWLPVWLRERFGERMT